MTQGISKLQIEKAFKELNDRDIDENFAGVFPANRINRLIDYKTMISAKKGKYLFIIANTDSDDKDDNCWWSIIGIEPKTDLLFLKRLVLMT